MIGRLKFGIKGKVDILMLGSEVESSDFLGDEK
jgi:hypothetical protein